MKDVVEELYVDTTNKHFMFELGRIFAQGKKVKILNEETVKENIAEEQKKGFAKSYNMMIKYWQDNDLAPDIKHFTSRKKKLFLICPVRKATEAEKQILATIIAKYENLGYAVHYPDRNTNQDPILNGVNTGGYKICLDNATAMAKAKTVAMYYNKESTGSMFDLGVTYELAKKDKTRKFVIENAFEFDKENFIDHKIKELSGKEEEQTL